jgi:hypothetical protein
MRAHLNRLPIVAAARIGRLWSLYRPRQLIDYSAANGVPKWVSYVGWIEYFVLLSLALPGVLALRRRGTSYFPLFTVAAIITLVAAAFYGRPRFRVPAEVSMVVLAAVGIEALRIALSRAHCSPDKGAAGR